MERTLDIAAPIMLVAGVLGILGHPLFYLIWRYVFPQPYENLTLRLIGSAICVPLLFRRRIPERYQLYMAPYWALTVCYNLPFLFSYFLLRNELSQVWLMSVIGGVFLLTFLVELYTALALFILGILGAYGAVLLSGKPEVSAMAYIQALVLISFPLIFGGIVNFQFQRIRSMQRRFERRLRNVTTQNARLTQEHNQLLSRFLSNVIVARLRNYRNRYGLDKALDLITRQEQRFCGIMQADARNFTKMFGLDSEMVVAERIHRCFTEITTTGQDLAVIKPVGDGIFVYSDEEHGRQNAVFNILSLAVFFVARVEEVNRKLAMGKSADEAGNREDEAPLNFGIAIHAGEVIYGNLASDTLIDPTIIGINVNKTARLEELTKIPEVRNLVGNNAIILSEELAFYASNFIHPNDLIPIRLDKRNLVLRDFPEVQLVYALTSEKAMTYYEQALEKIQFQRQHVSSDHESLGANRYRGLPYFYEMEGLGADTRWMAMIDVSTLPDRVVNDYAFSALEDLEFEINQTDGQWLIISTRNTPGEYDEVDMEARIFRIIEGLEEVSLGFDDLGKARPS